MAGSSAGSIFVDLLLRDTQYKQGLNRAGGSTNSFTGVVTADMRKVQQSFTSVLNPVNNLSSAIRNLGVGIASYLSVQKIVEISDQFTQLNSRLLIVSSSNQEFINLQEELYGIAIRTRQPLENIYNLYTRIAQALPESERGQYNLLEITENINKALAITGEGSAQASSAVLQFTQAVASGFQGSGQEINALLDSAPRLAVALQQSFGDGSKSLKKLAEDGELSTETILKALENTSGEAQKLAEEFDRTRVTVGQSLSNLETSFSRFISQNQTIQDALEYISNGFQGMAIVLDGLNDRLKDFIFLKEKIFSTGGSFTQITPEMFNDALPAEYTQYSAGDMQSAIDRLNRTNAPKSETEKEKKKRESEAKKAANEAKRTQDELNRIYEKNREVILGLDKATIDYNDTIKDLNTLLNAGKITMFEYSQAVIRAQEELEKTKENINSFGIDTEQFSKKAAENIQDAFADFLFDPFDQGLDGMAKGFIDTVRKMIAEAQAAQLAKYLFGDLAGGEGGGIFESLLGGLGSIFGGGGSSFNAAGMAAGAGFTPSTTWLPKFAEGGFLGPGQWGIAGEAGAELIYGGNSGATIVPQDKMGGGNRYIIDARGADQGAVIRLEQSLLALAGPGVIERRVVNAQQRGAL